MFPPYITVDVNFVFFFVGDLCIYTVIGGWGNKRSAIRKKISAYVLNEVHFDGLLNIRKPTKFLIEITKGRTTGAMFFYIVLSMYMLTLGVHVL